MADDLTSKRRGRRSDDELRCQVTFRVTTRREIRRLPDGLVYCSTELPAADRAQPSLHVAEPYSQVVALPTVVQR
jgi:hypothetical protein